MLEKLEQYRKLAIQLKELKKAEMDLRLEITDELLKGAAIGTHNFLEYDGFKVKAVKKVNYSLDQEMIKELIENDELSESEIECLRTKHELNLKAYKSNADDLGEEFLDAIEVKPATPSLDVEIG